MLFFLALVAVVWIALRLAVQQRSSSVWLVLPLAWLVLPFIPASNLLFYVGTVPCSCLITPLTQ